ncbi:DUF4350 domain-containing protein [Geobacter benzoatilyticus]|uniref:DUF4350 domain-containing protein n=1 Tax=Geobacter benzoatilyticus TaxID=2815309 RepID=A0ABX7Q740_9BACT|nr:DUF4350 domain-containing protein [Geobacter benzoatilyticus]QSV47012.1 DUF4350 domain-containing protein [Geobacter benzoatilyticus]
MNASVKRVVTLFGIAVCMIISSAMVSWGAAPLVLVDQGHGQRFVVEQEGELHLSGLAAILKEEGLQVATGRERLTDDSLHKVAALVISGPFAPLAPEEVEAVVRFLERGGRVALMLHIGQPLAGLIHRVGADFSNSVLHERQNVIADNDITFRVRDLATHPLFGGMEQFGLYGGWALNGLTPLARTSAEAWVDLDGNRKLSARDAVDRFAVVAEGNIGAGRILIFGDDAIFQNRYLDDGNTRLARNLAHWLAGG